MIGFEHSGNFSNSEKFLDKMLRLTGSSLFDKYGKMGVEALQAATPKRTGTTADSWYYEVVRSLGTVEIRWNNSNISDNVLVAVLIQYGHGTKNGGYVQGYDYINPAMRKVFDKIAEDVWKEVER